MDKELDEHLLNHPQGNLEVDKTKIAKAFTIYIVLLVICLILYISVGVFLFQRDNGISLFRREVMFTVSITLIGLIPNYFLQKELYLLYQKSVIKSALTPVLIWFIIIITPYLFQSYQGVTDMKAPSTMLIIFSCLFSWYASLCFLISWYFQHQNKLKYVLSLLIFLAIKPSINSFYPFHRMTKILDDNFLPTHSDKITTTFLGHWLYAFASGLFSALLFSILIGITSYAISDDLLPRFLYITVIAAVLFGLILFSILPPLNRFYERYYTTVLKKSIWKASLWGISLWLLLGALFGYLIYGIFMVPLLGIVLGIPIIWTSFKVEHLSNKQWMQGLVFYWILGVIIIILILL